MATRSLNKVMLIGNLTRDPELRYTAQGTAVCNFGVATNRYWVTDVGEKKEDTEFHRIVAWNKLAELCAQLLAKGRKVYVEGRLQTRTWSGADGAQRTTTEVVISDMVILDSRRAFEAAKATASTTVGEEIDISAEKAAPVEEKKEEKTEKKAGKKEEVTEEETGGGGGTGASRVKADDQSDQGEEKTEAKKKEKSSSAKASEDKEEKVSPDEIPF